MSNGLADHVGLHYVCKLLRLLREGFFAVGSGLKESGILVDDR